MKMLEASLLKQFISYDAFKKIDIRQKDLENKSTKLLNQLTDAFESVKENLDLRIDGQCEKLLKTKFEKYEKVKKDFQNFFNVEQITDQFCKKADVEMVNTLNKAKVNNAELKHTNFLIDNLNDRVKHLSTILAEMA